MEKTTRLRAVREAQGRGLRETAALAHVDPGQLSRVERGLERPSADFLLRIGQVLGLRDLVRQLEMWR